MLKELLKFESNIKTKVAYCFSEAYSQPNAYLNMVNYLTMGNIQNFYMCLTESLRNKIAREFSEEFKRSYDEDINITSDILTNILKTVTLFRNACAHEERLYNFKLFKPAKSSQVSQIMEIENVLLSKGNMFTMTAFLKFVLTKKEYAEYISSLAGLFASYSNNFRTVRINDIQEMMGFKEEWKTMVLHND